MNITKVERIPTQQLTRWQKAKADIYKRLRRIKPELDAIYQDWPVERVQVNKVGYEYQYNPKRLEQIPIEVQRLIDTALQLDDSGKPARWFFDTYVMGAYRDGTVKAAGSISGQAEAAGLVAQAAQVSPEEILFSEPYQRRLELAGSRSYNAMKGFADGNADQLARIMTEGIALGKSPREIGRSINQAFSWMTGYRALRIARTEVNKAFTDAKLEQTQQARDLGLDVRVMHVSALVAATRPTHAARHGKIYTKREQEEFWSEGSNRINCLCSTSEILYINGKPINQSLIEKQRERGKLYFSDK